MPGYGQSSKDIDHTDPFGDLAYAIRGLLDELGIEKAHLVGNSYGGAAALRLALDRPDKVDRLVLMGPGGVRTTRALPTKGLNSLFGYYGGDPSRRSSPRSSASTWCTTVRRCPTSSSTCATRPASSPRWSPTRTRPSPGALRTLLRMDFTRDRRLAHLRTPTLVIWGRTTR